MGHQNRLKYLSGSSQTPNQSNMNTLVVLSLVVCAVSAGIIPAHYGYGGASEQHHSQDEAGNYAYGYSDPNSHKEESGNAYGGVKGSYSYVAPDGSVIHNDYYADENGFRSNLAPTAAHDVYPEPDYSHHTGHHVAHVAGVYHGAASAYHGVAHGAHHGVAHHGLAHHGAYAAAPHYGAFSYGFATGHPVYAAPHYAAGPVYAGYH